jgi:hypothetical protein
VTAVQRQRDAARAIKLADGTYLIRSGCCQPRTCAPAEGMRCCLSARCECAWGPRWVGNWTTPPAVKTHTVRNVAIVGTVVSVSAAITAATVWVIATNIVAVVITLALTGLLAATVASIRGRRGRGGYTVNNYYR